MYIIPKSGLDHDNDETIDKKKTILSLERVPYILRKQSKWKATMGTGTCSRVCPYSFSFSYSYSYSFHCCTTLYIYVYIYVYIGVCVYIYICSCSYRLTLVVVILYNNRHRLQIAVTTFECCSPGFPLCSSLASH